MLMLFIQGLVIGFAISAPFGPIGILCIQRTLQNGFWVGLATGMGAAFADNIYGLIAAFSISAITKFLFAFEYWIRVLGGLVLVYFGLKLLMIESKLMKTKTDAMESIWRAFGSTVLLTLTSPITLLSFMAVFSVLGLGGKNMDYLQALALVSGIFISSTLWWLALTCSVTFFLDEYISQRWMKFVNWIAGSIMLAFSVYALKIIF
ncbi:homoserine/Threonine efflux protein [Legionella massiliensis]|uniref:Homoserine/Threonine efflux protein n=1 Tax=Legionella massiliensis TaxID=1034943 RepID=A0A078KTL3_9GAMM|nr:LysE family transporter [Legionella massiliensis]CDZ76302.1 homoserine/Threonine efflux protein [Legionella massiliensis]CEE12040.1 LysE type translocator [Legionella massiliensis]